MQCPVCQSEVTPQSTFCAHCGAPLTAATPPPGYTSPGYQAPPPSAGYTQVPPAYTAPPPGYAQSPPSYPPPAAGAGGLSPNSAAAIAYITIIPAIIFLVVEPYNRIPFVKFHSFQSIALTVAWVAVWIVVSILHAILHFIPLIGFLFILVDLAIAVGFFAIWLITILKASKGEWYKIPVIGDFALKQSQS